MPTMLRHARISSMRISSGTAVAYTTHAAAITEDAGRPGRACVSTSACCCQLAFSPASFESRLDAAARVDSAFFRPICTSQVTATSSTPSREPDAGQGYSEQPFRDDSLDVRFQQSIEQQMQTSTSKIGKVLAQDDLTQVDLRIEGVQALTCHCA